VLDAALCNSPQLCESDSTILPEQVNTTYAAQVCTPALEKALRDLLALGPDYASSSVHSMLRICVGSAKPIAPGPPDLSASVQFLIPTPLQVALAEANYRPDVQSHEDLSPRLAQKPDFLSGVDNSLFPNPAAVFVESVKTQARQAYRFLNSFVFPPVHQGKWQFCVTIHSLERSCYVALFSAETVLTNDAATRRHFVDKSAFYSSYNGVVYHLGWRGYENTKFGEGSTVMLEADLDASPRTLRFFVNDTVQRTVVTDIPSEIRFGLFSYNIVDAFTVTLRKVTETAVYQRPPLPPLPWGTDWAVEQEMFLPRELSRKAQLAQPILDLYRATPFPHGDFPLSPDCFLLSSDEALQANGCHFASISQSWESVVVLPSLDRAKWQFRVLFKDGVHITIGLVKSGTVVRSKVELGLHRDHDSVAYSSFGPVIHHGEQWTGNLPYATGSTVMLEADLSATPPTLHFFVDDKEQPVFVTNIPLSITFVVSLYGCGTEIVVSLREAYWSPRRGLPNSIPCKYYS
jgi:hypothetical protein